jgi:quinolinate synthase
MDVTGEQADVATIIPLLTEFEKEHISERQALPEQYLGLSDEEMDRRIAVARATLGTKLVILGHHYQRDEVIKFADHTGDSFGLARQVAKRPDADYIVFCGVHFMAESADILSAPHQQVILPDLAAGCSMADMVEPEQLETCWEELQQMGISGIVPVTYINSAASIKSFVGERGGTVCTSSNAMATLKWAFERGEKILFMPDQHLGRNTGLQDGDSARSDGGLEPERNLRWTRSCRRAAREDDPVEGSLLGARALHGEADRSRPHTASGHPRHRASRSAVGRRSGC